MSYREAKSKYISYLKTYVVSSTLEYYYNIFGIFETYLLVIGEYELLMWQFSEELIIDYLSYLRSLDITNVSVRTYYRGFKAFLRFCYNKGFLSTDITRDIKVPRPDPRLVVPLTCEEVTFIRSLIDKTVLPERNHIIFTLMLDCGLRKNEVINLNSNDVNLDDGYIVIRNGKFSKSRLVPIPKLLRSQLFDYGYDCNASSSLLTTVTGERLSSYAINCFFAKLKKRCNRNVYPHLLRHTFATSFILSGGSLEILRLLMGHSDYNVTRNYLHIAAEMSISNVNVYRLDDVFNNCYCFNKK